MRLRTLTQLLSPTRAKMARTLATVLAVTVLAAAGGVLWEMNSSHSHEDVTGQSLELPLPSTLEAVSAGAELIVPARLLSQRDDERQLTEADGTIRGRRLDHSWTLETGVPLKGVFPEGQRLEVQSTTEIRLNNNVAGQPPIVITGFAPVLRVGSQYLFFLHRFTDEFGTFWSIAGPFGVAAMDKKGAIEFSLSDEMRTRAEHESSPLLLGSRLSVADVQRAIANPAPTPVLTIPTVTAGGPDLTARGYALEQLISEVDGGLDASRVQGRALELLGSEALADPVFCAKAESLVNQTGELRVTFGCSPMPR